MKATLITLIFVASIAGASGREHNLLVDLARPRTLRLTCASATDSTITADIKKSGSDFDATGWTGLFWIGDEQGGVTITNRSYRYGQMSWDFTAANVPTNGRYNIMILGAKDGRTEEWGSGLATVNANPSKDSLPAQWGEESETYHIATNALRIAQAAYLDAGAAMSMASANSVTGAAHTVQIDALNVETGRLGVAIGDLRAVALTNETDAIALAALADYVSTNRTDETDPRAMRLYHYGDPDIVITPTNFFGFNPATGTITGYTGTNPDVVIPYEINGDPVVAIGDSAFEGNDVIRKLLAPKTLTTIGDGAFIYSSLTTLTAPALTSIGDGAFVYSSLTTLTAPALTSIGDYAFEGSSLTTLTAPALTSIGNYAFYGSSLTTLTAPALTSIGNSAFVYSSTLTSVYYGADKPMEGEGIYDGTPANLVNYVTNPQATGWGATFGGRPVVRLDLHGGAVYSGGQLVATIDDIPAVPDVTAQCSAWTTNVVSSGTNVITSAWGNQPRLELSGAGVIDFDFGTANSGLHRLTLSLWSGTNSVSWITNNVDFAEIPDLETDAYNTILIRKIGSAKAEGRQL